MGGERSEQGGKRENKKKFRLPRWFVAFLVAILAEGIVTFGLMTSLAYVSFQLRLSMEVIRAWLVLLYIVPCLLGGCMVRWVGLRPPLAWGLGAGAVFYGGLVLLSSVQGLSEPKLEISLLCILSAAMGIFLGEKRRLRKNLDKKSDGNE